MPKQVVLSANTDWNFANFRGGLIRALLSAGYKTIVIAPRDHLAEKIIPGLDVDRIVVQMDRSGLNPLADLALLLQYWRALKRLRPAAYLSYTIKPNIYGSLVAGFLGIPALPNVSGLGTVFIRNGPLQQLVASLYRVGFRKVPVVFFQNYEDRDLFVRRRIVRADQARVIPGSGVDIERFALEPSRAGPPVFLLIGRLLRDKGVVEFVEAARSLRTTLPAARFQLLGPIDEGNRTAITRGEVDSWVAEGVIEYLGTTDDVRPAIAAATAVVLPSYREGLPRSLLEAGAMGRPLIATNAPGCRAVVEDGINGYLCAVRDSASLAAAMRRMVELPEAERLAMGQAARGKVQAKFSEDCVIRAYLDVLQSLEGSQ